jgi:hypothetical protein
MLNANVLDQVDRAAKVLRQIAEGHYPGAVGRGYAPNADAPDDELIGLAQSLEALVKVAKRAEATGAGKRKQRAPSSSR